MKLTKKLRDHCPTGRVCPRIYLTDQDTLIVQGYRVGQERLFRIAIGEGQTAVEIPRSLVSEVALSRPQVVVTDRDTLIVWGTAVLDPEALETLGLPDHENAVELSRSVLPEVLAPDRLSHTSLVEVR